MRISETPLAFLVLFTSCVNSFPLVLDSVENSLTETSFERRQVQGPGALPVTPPPFDPKAQYVSNQGAHAFIAPGPNDERGPCPGLNAMSNHGYLPRNGRATIQQFIDGTNAVFGMAKDLGGFLALYGALVDGDGSSWSIGGQVRTGISGSHNNYETDSSPLKSDLSQYGNNQRLILSQFYNLYNRQPATGANYNLDVLRAFRKDRFYESIQKNPNYFYGPFTGIEVSQAAFTFIYRFMSNKSAQNPEGVLDRNTLKSFMSITGPENNLAWKFGNERIPDNWYKRNPSDEYSVPYFQADILYFAQTTPEVFNVGCNNGRVNSYNSISPETISGGVYTAADVAKGPLCFSAAFLVAEAAKVANLSSSVLSKLNSAFSSLSNAVGSNCKPINSLNTTALSACPGFSFYGGPTGPVAPGAIQS